MQGNDLLNKLSHNKKFLFIVPNLIYVYRLIYYYNSNFKEGLELFFSEVIVLSLVFLGITALVYLFLMNVLKDEQKAFCILCFVCMFYFFKFDLIKLLLFIVFILILIIDFKKIIKFKLDTVVCLLSFVIIFLFSFSFFTSISNVLYMVLNSRSFDNNNTVNVDDDFDTPNIYYIHSDAMMSMDTMKKYFSYDNLYLKYYFDENGYYLNEDASLVAGHRTQRALVAMFNPDYYDEFYKDYLIDLENVYLGKNKKTSFIVDYYELMDKRLDNELFRALDKKDYKKIAIAEFNSNTSLDVDYYYDYYYYENHARHIDENNSELRLLKDNSDFSLNAYVAFLHLRGVLDSTMFYEFTKDINFLNYELVDYDSFDSSKYEHTNRAMEDNNYWLSKAILKGLDSSFDIDDEKFVFVDFKTNHDPYTFDRNGNVIEETSKYELKFYLTNYIYSSYLLVELLDFIRTNDEDAVIIVQGDHGIHTRSDDEMIDYFNTDIEGVQEIRNSVISAVYVPDKYKNGDEEYLDNPLNISRYIVNNYVGDNYQYLN